MNKKAIHVFEDDPTIVTEILGWQSAYVEPAFMHPTYILE